MDKLGKIGLPLLVVVGSVFAFGLMIKFRRTAEPSPVVSTPPTVEVRSLERVDYPFVIRSQGTVEAATSVRLVSQVDGQALEVNPALKKGGFFSRGDLLVQLDERDYKLAVTRANSQVAAAKLRLATAEAEAKIAAEDWEELGRRDAASPLLLREPQLMEARASLAAAEADLAKAELDLERTRIVAPFDGRVSSATVDPGQFVRRGEQLAAVFGVETVEVSLPLPLADFEFLDLPAERTREAFEQKPTRVTLIGRLGRHEHRWYGNVVRVGGEVDVQSRMSSVIVSVDDPYRGGATTDAPPLKVGMFVEAEIEGRTAKGVYVVPRAKLWESERALAVDANNKLRIRPLDILRTDRSAAVIAGGFEVGDQLCVSAVDIPQDGRDVKPVIATEGATE